MIYYKPVIGSYWASKNGHIYQYYKILTAFHYNSDRDRNWIRMIKPNPDAPGYIPDVGACTNVGYDWFKQFVVPACGICLVACPKGLEIHESSAEHAMNVVHEL